MARAAGLAWKVLAVAGIVGYPILIHLGLTGGAADPARTVLLMAPMAALGCWPSRARRTGCYRSSSRQAPPAPPGCWRAARGWDDAAVRRTHAAAYLHAGTVRPDAAPGGKPSSRALRAAARGGTLPPVMERHTRAHGCGACSSPRSSRAPRSSWRSVTESWSLFINVLSFPLVGLMFAGDYLYRVIRYRHLPQSSIATAIQAYAKDRASSFCRAEASPMADLPLVRHDPDLAFAHRRGEIVRAGEFRRGIAPRRNASGSPLRNQPLHGSLPLRRRLCRGAAARPDQPDAAHPYARRDREAGSRLPGPLLPRRRRRSALRCARRRLAHGTGDTGRSASPPSCSPPALPAILCRIPSPGAGWSQRRWPRSSACESGTSPAWRSSAPCRRSTCTAWNRRCSCRCRARWSCMAAARSFRGHLRRARDPATAAGTSDHAGPLARAAGGRDRPAPA